MLALRPGRASAKRTAGRGVSAVLGAALLIGLGAILGDPACLAVMWRAVALGIPALAVIPVLLAIPLLVFLWTRLLLANPIGAMEPGGPVTILKRSWALTAGRFWQLLGFLILLMIVAIVASGAIAAVGGSLIALTSGRPGRIRYHSIWC